MALLSHFLHDCSKSSKFYCLFQGQAMVFPFPKVPAAHALKVSSPLPIEQLTESMLALSDMAVMLTQGFDHISYCSNSVYNLLGLDSDVIMSSGWALLFQHIHPQDRELLVKKVFPAIRVCAKKSSPEDRKLVTFSYTLRMRHANGHYLLMALENQPIKWPQEKWPNSYMSVLKNITAFGDTHKMVLTVNHYRTDQRPETTYRREFEFRWKPFTVREVEVMRLVTAGLTSKQIAERLHISPETVRNHRKSLLSKSACASSSELVSFASRHGML
jgi:DNA-binding CsgD family transcriptional regulator